MGWDGIAWHRYSRPAGERIGHTDGQSSKAKRNNNTQVKVSAGQRVPQEDTTRGERRGEEPRKSQVVCGCADCIDTLLQQPQSVHGQRTTFGLASTCH